MARRRRSRGEVSVDLFSFLNIMAATIGVQTLLIVVMALQIRPGDQTVQFIPGDSEGNKAGKAANYLICEKENRFRLWRDGLDRQVARTDPAVNQFLDAIAQSATPQYLVIGVRPDCSSAFDRVRLAAEERGLDVGYEPMDPKWTIKLPNQEVQASL